MKRRKAPVEKGETSCRILTADRLDALRVLQSDGKENPKSTRARKKVRGRIVWINELHHFFLAEAQVFGHTMRECFKF